MFTEDTLGVYPEHKYWASSSVARCLMFYDWEKPVGPEWLGVAAEIFSEFGQAIFEGTGNLGERHSHGRFSRVQKKLSSFLGANPKNSFDIRLRSQPSVEKDAFFPCDVEMVLGVHESGRKEGCPVQTVRALIASAYRPLFRSSTPPAQPVFTSDCPFFQQHRISFCFVPARFPPSAHRHPRPTLVDRGRRFGIHRLRQLPPQVIPRQQPTPALEPDHLLRFPGIRIDPAPSLGRRGPAQVLMRPHVVVPAPELDHQPRQRLPAIDLQSIKPGLERAKQPLDAPVHPRAARHRELLADMGQGAHPPKHPAPEHRIVIGAYRPGLSKAPHGQKQMPQERPRIALLQYLQGQQGPRAVIFDAQDGVNLSRHIPLARHVQGPDRIPGTGPGWAPPDLPS